MTVACGSGRCFCAVSRSEFFLEKQDVENSGGDADLKYDLPVPVSPRPVGMRRSRKKAAGFPLPGLEN